MTMNNDDLMTLDEFRKAMKKFAKRKRKYYFNRSISKTEKSNMLNSQHARFRPTLVVDPKKKRKKIGINKKMSYFDSDECFNEENF